MKCYKGFECKKIKVAEVDLLGHLSSGECVVLVQGPLVFYSLPF